MPFKPGTVSNPNGRPKGSKNKNNYVREEIQKWFDENIGDLLEAIAGMEESEKVKYATALLPYIVPKLKDHTLEIKGNVDITWNETKTYEIDGKTNKVSRPARRPKNN
ncbi:unnamed protein product [marine sediment metagenome]|uniref:DUF5681 domain-containing protein n=1 Tax=marine sediment metagenome TaxID=412755 RepID=X0T791_9ZZZZ